MSQATWSYLQNPFDNVTKRSFKRMLILATDHFDKLEKQAPANAAIADMLAASRPQFDAYVKQYRQNNTDAANYKMHTARMEALLEELTSTLIRRWDVRTQVEYDVVTPEYQAILPEGRKPFQSGAYDLRISQVHSLADRLAGFPPLAALEQEVRDFAEKLRLARTAQQGVENTDQNNSDELERRRKALAVAMHRTFGGLVQLYADDIVRVETFYELKYLRSNSGKDNIGDGESTAQTFDLPPGETLTVLTDAIGTDDTILVTNNGRTAIYTLLAASGDAPDWDAASIVEPGQSAVLTASATDRLLLIYNDGDTEGQAMVEYV